LNNYCKRSSALKTEIMITEIKEKIFLANMDYGFGNTESWLEVVKRIDNKGNEYLVFCRGKHHVHAWHCNTININDSRIIELKEKSSFEDEM